MEKLYFITNPYSSIPLIEQITKVCEGGGKLIQLRMKDISYEEGLNLAKEARIITKKFGAKLIMNDFIDLANQIDVDGLHLGQSDGDIKEARKLLGEKVLGLTINDLSQSENKDKTQYADYFGVGPFRVTTTKKNLSTVLTPKIINKIIENLYPKPIYLIGGIELNHIKELKLYNISGVAVSSALSEASDITKTTQEFIDILNA